MANRYGLFFARGGTVLRLPINPAKLPESQEVELTSYNILGLGPVEVPRTPGVKKLSISSYFPGESSPQALTSGDFEPPGTYVQFFRSAMQDKAPIVYTPVRQQPDGTPYLEQVAGYPVIVSQFSIEEKGGEPGDLYYTLELSEYRELQAKTVVLDTPQAQSDAAIPVTEEPAREVPEGQLVVGGYATVNGRFWYTSYGDAPFGNGNGRRVQIRRILTAEGRPYPILIYSESGGQLGWTDADALTPEVVDA